MRMCKYSHAVELNACLRKCESNRVFGLSFLNSSDKSMASIGSGKWRKGKACVFMAFR